MARPMKDWKKQFDELYGSTLWQSHLSKKPYDGEFPQYISCGEDIKAFISQVETGAYDRGGKEQAKISAKFYYRHEADAYEKAANAVKERFAEECRTHDPLEKQFTSMDLGTIEQTIRELKS